MTETQIQEWIDLGVAYVGNFGLKLVAAIAILIIGYMIAGLIKQWSIKLMKRRNLEPTLIGFIASLLYALLLAFVVIAALSELGIETASFIAVVGAAGLAIGLALQGSLANFAAGVLMLIFRPFKADDFVEAAGVSGTVEEIHIFTTQLRTGDNKTVIIPNGKIMSNAITNYSTKGTRRIDFVFGVGYDAKLDHVRSVLSEEIAKNERIMKDKDVLIAVSELADSSVNFTVRVWSLSSDYWSVRFDLIESVKKRFDAEGINIPFPQRDLHIIKDDD